MNRTKHTDIRDFGRALKGWGITPHEYHLALKPWDHSWQVPAHMVETVCLRLENIIEGKKKMLAAAADEEVPSFFSVEDLPEPRRTHFFIIRNEKCFQPANDESLARRMPGCTGGSSAVPQMKRDTAIEVAVKDATEVREPRYVYEVKLIGVASPQDASFKASKPKAVRARKAKRARKPK